MRNVANGPDSGGRPAVMFVEFEQEGADLRASECNGGRAAREENTELVEEIRRQFEAAQGDAS